METNRQREGKKKKKNMINNILNLNRPKSWPKKKLPQRSSIFLLISLSTLLFFFFFVSYNLFPKFLLPNSSQNALTPQFLHCTSQTLTLGEKFLWYAPHSGFSNQLSEFKNAIVIAGVLNRTLVVPPVLDHHAVALGSCPKFRVLEPKELRMLVWDHVVELIRSGRYVSMADIIDISSLLTSSTIRTIDFRTFVSLWCNLRADFACSDELNAQSSVFTSLRQCGSLLSGIDGNVDKCVYATDEDCRTTVWTYQKDDDRVLDTFQPDEQLKKKKKISYVRRHRDVYKTLGHGSEAESSTVLALGSLFTSPYKGSQLYIDIHEAPKDQKIQSLIEKIEFLPFVPEIISAGKYFALETIKAPFLCAQLRLVDGQFKNHWKATFLGLKQKLESLRLEGPLPIHIFVMTDLPEGNWTGNYLGDLAKDTDSFKLYFLTEDDDLVTETAKKLLAAGHGLRSGFVPKSLDGSKMREYCPSQRLPDVLLYVEETVCSCASLGFIGTLGSTIAESIELMRKFGACSSQRQTVS